MGYMDMSFIFMYLEENERSLLLTMILQSELNYYCNEQFTLH